MKVQTTKKGSSNRYEMSLSGLKNKIIALWLERRFLVQTFEFDNELESVDVKAVRAVLDEPVDSNPTVEPEVKSC